MAQYNKLTKIKQKENRRSDLSLEYHHLTSYSVPYTDFLYGDDVPKSVKEIQDINRVRKGIVRPHGINYRGRCGREVDLLNEEIPSEEEVGDSSLEEEAHQIHIKVASQKT